MKTVKDGKWWEYFTNFCYKSNLEDGQESEFIKRLFDAWNDEGKIYPYVLAQKLAQDVEKSFSEKQIEETESLSESDYINLTLKKATAWAKQNNIYNNRLGRFLSDPACILRALRGEFYKPLFLFCSDFAEKNGELTEEDVLKKSSIRAFHPELYEMLKYSLGTKFID